MGDALEVPARAPGAARPLVRLDEGTKQLCAPPQGETRVDYAHFLRALCDEHFADAERIVLMQDNLDTHSPASLDEARNLIRFTRSNSRNAGAARSGRAAAR